MSASTECLRVVFFGDSICFGQGVSLHRGWVARTAAALADLSRETGRELLVVNASVNGNTTRQALERMPYDVQSHGVDVLLVQFGLNDCNYWESDRGRPRVSPRAFQANLEEIVSRAEAFGARRVLLNTNHPTLRDDATMSFTNVTYEDSNREYNAIIRDVAKSIGQPLVTLNDVEHAFLVKTRGERESLSELLLADQLHPSGAGHDLYFDLVYPAVERAVSVLAVAA